jgi:hypothetical protein
MFFHWKGGEKMSWKKILLILAVVGAVSFASAPKSDAHVSVGIGIGFPVGFAYGYPYAGYYPYGYAYPYGYGYPYAYGYYPYGFGSRVVVSRPVVVHRGGHHVVHHHH